MTRSTRTTARLSVTAAAATAPLLLLPWTATPALAHGAPTSPVSRVYACSPDGGSAGTAACRAAIAANGGASFAAWDNLRVPGVDGRDRQVIPDGKLCSGNLSAYRGLDLARADFPATRLTAGARMTMTYASPIAHAGTFKLYLSKPGYDPSKPLKWSDLPATPFAEVKDPPLTNGAYHIQATLPSGRTGRQMLYTIWQTSSTPDTYYSCSDVVFSGSGSGPGSGTGSGSGGNSGTGAKAEKKEPARKPSPSPTHAAHHTSSASPSPSASAADEPRKDASSAPVTSDDSTPVAEATRADAGPSAPLLAAGAAGVLLITAAVAFLPRLRRR
ncbi:lytic polysaccharide monooxygenase [Streptomyces sp. LaPpAH-108]|uniref:lytic polysaccharide monooxygenase n=1 Tax=Streptomyces sp. LaPpAH-108 TaxID=1155714 RepID=UPI0003738D22|nr:lytic polysaccharide monooxygenase [Streptomyces sp. LaPpAH-108]